MRPTHAVIRLSNLKYNFKNIREKVGPRKVMAVVKADAYGHGVNEIVKTLLSLGKNKPDYFAVAIAAEGVELRKLKVKEPILIFEPFSKEEAFSAVKFNLIATVFNENHLKILEEAKRKSKINSSKKIKVHVNVDTGMHRLGVNYNGAFEFISKLALNENFEIDGIYTHFATSDEKNKSYANLQLKRFNNLLKYLKTENINYGIVHAANSGAILDMPEAYFDMVRPGISLYGYYPSLETTESIPLKPVMTLYSQVASVKVIEKGETVSYGRKFKAKTSTKIVTVPIGYADGFNRNLTNKTEALIKGKRYKQVGRVTMDRIMFEIGNDNIKPGDKVILIGSDKNDQIYAWEWCKTLRTIPYEITCAISKRVPRLYKN